MRNGVSAALTEPITLKFSRAVSPDSHQIAPGDGFSFPLSVYGDGDYAILVNLIPKDPALKLALTVDGTPAGTFNVRQPSRANNAGLPLAARLQIHLARGEQENERRPQRWC